MFQPHTLEKFIEQENSEEIGGDWEKVPIPRTMAITQRDAPPTGGRKRIAGSINFHPLWIKFQRSRNFGGWIEDDFTEVTKPDALKDFKSKGAAKKPPVDTRPMDGLLSKSLTANMLHEVCPKPVVSLVWAMILTTQFSFSPVIFREHA